jgi:hypothetical protein
MTARSHVLVTAGCVLAAFIAGGVPAGAQPAGSAGFTLPLQWTAGADAHANATGSLDLDQAFASGRGRIFYEGQFDRYGGTDPWRTQLHNIGLVAALPAGSTAVEVGASVFRRANAGPWSPAGFHGASVVALLERDAGPATFTATYGAYARRFGDLPGLDQDEHQAGLRALVNLPSRTTVIGSLAIGAKRYDGEPPDAAFVTAPDVVLTGRGQRGRGVVSLPALQPLAPGLPAESAVRSQWAWTARLAQSLDDRTGVWLEREARRTRGDLPPAVVWTPPLFFEDGVYDDPYAIDARTWRAGAKHAFERGDQVGIWGSRSQRSFPGLEVEGLPGVGRRDTLIRAGAEGVFPLLRSEHVGLDLEAGFQYVDHRSPESWARYTARVMRLGLQLAF